MGATLDLARAQNAHVTAVLDIGGWRRSRIVRDIGFSPCAQCARYGGVVGRALCATLDLARAHNAHVTVKRLKFIPEVRHDGTLLTVETVAAT